MNRPAPASRTSAPPGAIQGLLAWTVFAVVECWFLSLVRPLLRPGEHALASVHWGFTALSFLFYPVLGLVLGWLVGTLWERFRRGDRAGSRPAVIGTVSLTSGYGLNLAHSLLAGGDSVFVRPSPVHLGIALVLATALMIVAVAAGRSAEAARRWRALTNPWTVSILLIGLPWTTLNLMARATPTAKMAAAGVFPILVLGAAFLIHRAVGERTVRPAVARGVFGVLVVVTLALAMTRGQKARKVPPPPERAAGDRDAPSVLLITLDTVRADHTSLYGYRRETTPRLRELAKTATLYTRSVATGDMTLTTHGSIFTGLHARQHGAHRSESMPHGRPLAGQFDTLAEILSRAGYWTTAVVANTAYLSHVFGFAQGFQYYDVRGSVGLFGRIPAYSPRKWIRGIVTPFLPRALVESRYRDAATIDAEILPLLDRAKAAGTPFFLFVNYMDAHVPRIPPPPFDTMFPGKDDTYTMDRYYRTMREVCAGEREMDPEERRHQESQYDGAIAYLDREVDRILDALRERDLFDDMLIVITSDHGEAFGDRSLVNHGVSVYQDQVGVPLLVKYPGQTESGEVGALVSSIDLLPTILDVAGVDARPDHAAGRSLLRLEPGERRAVTSESYPFLVDVNPDFDRIERAVFYGPHKLVSSTKGKRELYDLSRDEAESVNLYERETALASELEALLDGWLDFTVAEVDSTGDVVLDKATYERLKALGYIQ